MGQTTITFLIAFAALYRGLTFLSRAFSLAEYLSSWTVGAGDDHSCSNGKML